MLNQIVSVYLEGKVGNSRRRAQTVWNQWQGWLKLHRIRNPRPLDCQRYVTEFSKDRAPATVHNTVGILRSIYSYLVAIEATERNIWQGGRHYYSIRQRNQVRPTAKITPSEVKTILARQGNAKNPDEVRDRALFYLLFGAGLRRSEARAINVGDVYVTEKRLVVRLPKTKSGKDDLQPIAAWAATRISDLVSQRMLEGADDKSPLFITFWAGGYNRIGSSTIYRIFKRGCAECGVKAAPHAARAAYATRLLEQGVARAEVARALRHGDDQSVGVYDKRLRSVSDNQGQDVTY